MNKDFFIEDLGSSSEDKDEDFKSTCQNWKRTARTNRENSPPVLAFYITSFGRDKWRDRNSNSSSSVGLSSEDGALGENSDQSVEEWMILDEEEQEGDSSIQLNLSYSSISSEDDEKGDQKVTSLQDPWAVSKKDKGSGEMTLLCRYYKPGNSLICPICKRTGHQAKNCHVQKKNPICVLCGIHGHLQKDCPSRLCPRCGLLSHGLRPCGRPPVWHQHCQRCGMTGHLSDACPDTWRQYHHIIQLEDSLRLQTVQAHKHEKRPAYCYNCSKSGHYGYECSQRRMFSGTFPSLPYVCHYDVLEEAPQMNPEPQNKITEFVSGAQSFHEQHFLEERNQLYQKRSKMKQEACSQASRRKTWPERRRERQEVKRLRREAQARREGGVLGRCQHTSDDESSYLDTFKSNRFTCPSKKTKKEVAGYQRSRKSRQAEWLKKRGGKKHAFLYPHKELDIGRENLLSPKQRVRHRRRPSFVSV